MSPQPPNSLGPPDAQTIEELYAGDPIARYRRLVESLKGSTNPSPDPGLTGKAVGVPPPPPSPMMNPQGPQQGSQWTGPGGWMGPPENMAQGQVVTQPTLARLGESGPEAVIPLNPGPGHKLSLGQEARYRSPRRIG